MKALKRKIYSDKKKTNERKRKKKMKDKKQVREKHESSIFVEKERIRSNKEKARKSVGRVGRREHRCGCYVWGTSKCNTIRRAERSTLVPVCHNISSIQNCFSVAYLQQVGRPHCGQQSFILLESVKFK